MSRWAVWSGASALVLLALGLGPWWSVGLACAAALAVMRAAR